MMRATITDIARQAGVSTATVDRVLNERPGVRARTRERVLSAARTVGYLGEDEPSAVPAEVVPLDFILQGGPNTFMGLLAGHLEATAAARGPEVVIRVHMVDGFSPEALAGTLHALAPGSRGVGLIALDHPLVREAIREVAARGLPVLTLVSDIGNVPSVGYVGIDNRAAGRLAGHLLGRFMPRRAGRGGAVRRLAQLPRPRGAGDGLPPHAGGGLPGAADRRAARGPRRPAAQLPRGPASCSRRGRGSAASTTSAPATAASRGRWRRPGGRAGWCSSATS